MEVSTWTNEKDVPDDATILECGWILKLKSLEKVGAQAVLKDFSSINTDAFQSLTPSTVTLRCLLPFAAACALEVSTSDIQAALTHAPATATRHALEYHEGDKRHEDKRSRL